MAKPLFHSSLYQFDQPQPSYWEASAGPSPVTGEALTTNESCDVAIIGGGYTGLSAALHLARDFDVDVRVLEAGHIGWGASGRNGGFCTMGSTKLSLKQQLSKFGAEQTRYFHRCTADAVELVRELGQSEDIDYLPQGNGEFVVADSDRHFANLKQFAEFKQRHTDVEISVLSKGEFAEKGYDSPQQHGALLIKPSFALHPLRYAQGLGAAAERRGAKIHAHSRVVQWRKEGSDHILETEKGSLRAKRVILTGNGFMPEQLHPGIADRPLPLQSAIVVTRPMSDEELLAKKWFSENPIINSRHMFFYYRILSDNRFMLGARADHIGSPEGAEQTYAGMKRAIEQEWPQFAGLEFDYQWRGLVCFGLGRRPSIGRMPEDRSIYFGYGYHGTGVSTATWSGREIAKWMVQESAGDEIMPTHLPAIMQGRSPKFPLSALRRQFLLAALKFYRLRDILDV